MLTRNRFDTIAIIPVDDLEIAPDVSLVKQTTTNLEMSADSFGNCVREFVRIVQRAYQLADSCQHRKPALGKVAFLVDTVQRNGCPPDQTGEQNQYR